MQNLKVGLCGPVQRIHIEELKSLLSLHLETCGWGKKSKSGVTSDELPQRGNFSLQLDPFTDREPPQRSPTLVTALFSAHRSSAQPDPSPDGEVGSEDDFYGSYHKGVIRRVLTQTYRPELTRP